MQPTELDQVLTSFALAGAILMKVFDDNVCEPGEESEKQLALELWECALAGGEKVAIAQKICIQLQQRGYDADVPEVPSWRLMVRLAEFEADPRRRKAAERQTELQAALQEVLRTVRAA